MHTPAGRWIQATSLRFSQCFRARTRGLARGTSFPSLVSHLCTSLFETLFIPQCAQRAHSDRFSPKQHAGNPEINPLPASPRSRTKLEARDLGCSSRKGFYPSGLVLCITDLTQIDTTLIQGQVFASAFTSPKVTCRVRSLPLFLPSTSRLSSSKVLSSFPQTSPIQVPDTDPQRSELWSFQALSPSGTLGLGDGGRPDLEEGSRRR